MTTTSEIADITSRGNPAPSLPMNTATRPVRFASFSGVPLWEDVANNRISFSRNLDMTPANFARTTGKRKIDPADARTTFELNGLTVFSPTSTPLAAKASPERRIVPRFQIGRAHV